MYIYINIHMFVNICICRLMYVCINVYQNDLFQGEKFYVLEGLFLYINFDTKTVFEKMA